MISDVARRVVVPSHNYLAFYQEGATLDPHTDREACEYTLSLCIDATIRRRMAPGRGCS
jgi:hypothetical protein